MKVYIATYSWYGQFGAYDDRYLVVTANTASEALGLALAHEEDTLAADWTLEEIQTTEPMVTWVAQDST